MKPFGDALRPQWINELEDEGYGGPYATPTTSIPCGFLSVSLMNLIKNDQKHNVKKFSRGTLTECQMVD